MDWPIKYMISSPFKTVYIKYRDVEISCLLCWLQFEIKRKVNSYQTDSFG